MRMSDEDPVKRRPRESDEEWEQRYRTMRHRRPGETDQEWGDRLFRQDRAYMAAVLEEAKEKAARRGKEPFDLDKLESLWKPFKYGEFLPPREMRQQTWERIYYFDHPEIMTLAEFAAEMQVLDERGAFD
jgi:hypothetical protein